MRYIAVNQAACEALGYTREELLGLTAPDVAREPEALQEYDEILAAGFRHGIAILTRKDGSELRLAYRAERTRMGRMEVYVSVGFAAVGAS